MLSIYKWISGFFMLCLFATAYAQEAPASEKTLQQLDQDVNNNTNKMYDVLNKKIAPAISEENTAIQTLNTTVTAGITGNKGLGTITNTPSEQNFSNWTPSTEDLANMVQQGLQTGSLKDQIKYYNAKFHIPEVTDLTPGKPNSTMGNYGVFAAVATNAALSVADKSFDNAAQIVQQIQWLYAQIDKQETVKDSVDLNSAILLKIAALQADLIRLQSQQLKMQAVTQQGNNSERTFMADFVQNVK